MDEKSLRIQRNARIVLAIETVLLFVVTYFWPYWILAFLGLAIWFTTVSLFGLRIRDSVAEGKNEWTSR